jgi:hypothetical protein
MTLSSNSSSSADQLLGAPVVLPERGRTHLLVEGGDALLLAGDVKDDLGDRRVVPSDP